MTAPATNTPASIIQDAAIDAGMVQEGTPLSAEKYAQYFRRLNDLINLKQTQGLKLFLLQEIEVPLVTGTSRYSIGPGGDVNMVKPTRIQEAYYVEPQGYSRRPLTIMPWSDWLLTNQGAGNSSINGIMVDYQPSLVWINVWNSPSSVAAGGELWLLARTQVLNTISLTEEMNFPPEWRIALRWGLADEICTNQPESVMARCQQRSVVYWKMLEDQDLENGEVRFTPSDYARYPSRFG